MAEYNIQGPEKALLDRAAGGSFDTLPPDRQKQVFDTFFQGTPIHTQEGWTQTLPAAPTTKLETPLPRPPATQLAAVAPKDPVNWDPVQWDQAPGPMGEPKWDGVERMMEPGLKGIAQRAMNFNSSQALFTPEQQKLQLGLGLGALTGGPGWGLLKTMLGQGAAAGATEAITGQVTGEGGSLGDTAKAAGLGAAGGGLGYGVGKGLGLGYDKLAQLIKGPGAKQAYNEAMRIFGKEVADREFKIASDRAMTAAVSGAETNQAGREVANKLTDYVSKTIPPLKGVRQGAEGLEDLVSVKAYDTVHNWFDAYIKGAKSQGAGMHIRLLPEEARAAGIKNMIASKDKGDKLVSVTVEDAVEGMLGLSKKAPDVYKQIFRQLDDLKIIDPAASAGYKAYMGLKGYLESNKLLKGGPFDLAKAQDAFRTGGHKALQSRRAMEVEDIVKGTQIPTPRVAPAHPPMPVEPAAPGTMTVNPWIAHALGRATGVPGAGALAHGAAYGMKGLPMGPVPQDTGIGTLLQRLLQMGGGTAGPEAGR